jgi:hypothetical protein
MRFRFTIRDLLWLTLVAALAAGWWVDHRQPRPWPDKAGLPQYSIPQSEFPQGFGRPVPREAQTDFGKS